MKNFCNPVVRWKLPRGFTVDWSLRIFVALGLLFVFALGPVLADQKDPRLDAWFNRLAKTTDAAEAEQIIDKIWHTWITNGEELVDSAMSRGLIAMNQGAYETSLKHFTDVISLAPGHAEGWNKRATVHFLMGNYSESVADIHRTLELEPRHFGALSGLGMIYHELGKDKAAIRVMEKALKINPHLETLQENLRELKTKVEGKPI
jgi:tetratricopeptide (TPR) repeat protein